MNRFASTVMTAVSFILASGLCFAQTPDTSAKEKATGVKVDNGSTELLSTSAAPEAAGKKKEPAKPFAKLKPLGALSVSCDAAQTEILIDGAFIGMLPLPGPWVTKAGSHRIEFRTPGRAPQIIETTVLGGAQNLVDCNPAAGQLNVNDETTRPPKYRWAPMTTADVGFGIAVAGLVSLGVGAWYGRESVDRADEAGGEARQQRAHELLDVGAHGPAWAAERACTKGPRAAALRSGMQHTPSPRSEWRRRARRARPSAAPPRA